MSVCSLTKFTITRNVDNEFIFVIKENGKTTPMTISPSDTFTLKLIRLDDNTTIDLQKVLNVIDADNGKVQLLITATEANGLISRRGSWADHYFIRSTYSLVIEADTTVNGTFVARIGKVYVG